MEAENEALIDLLLQVGDQCAWPIASRWLQLPIISYPCSALLLHLDHGSHACMRLAGPMQVAEDLLGPRTYNRRQDVPRQWPRNRGWFEDQMLERDDAYFIAQFRLNKETFYYVCDAIRAHPGLAKASRTRHQSVEEQLACALTYLAGGARMHEVGEGTGWSKPVISRCVKWVTHAIVVCLGDAIKFPSTPFEADTIVQGFAALAVGVGAPNTRGMPQIIGALDGTHIPIAKPDGAADQYINRKGFHSLNVQAVSDSNCKFLDVFVGFSGRAHDNAVFGSSPLFDAMANGDLGDLFKSRSRTYTVAGQQKRVPLLLIADAGYIGCGCPFVLPSYKPTAVVNDQNKAAFNKKHVSTRNPIERAFGILKNRWRCLLHARKLKMQTHLNVILACFVLHNICVTKRVPAPQDDDPRIQQLLAVYNNNNALDPLDADEDPDDGDLRVTMTSVVCAPV